MTLWFVSCFASAALLVGSALVWTALEGSDPRLLALRFRVTRAVRRWWCRDVRQHWRHPSAIWWNEGGTGAHCDVCGARFQSLADAHGVDERVARRTMRRLIEEERLRNLRHGGPCEGEPFERVRKITR